MTSKNLRKIDVWKQPITADRGLQQAADEIDRLAKRVAELEAELSRLCDILSEDDVAIVRTLIEGFRDMRDRDAAPEITE